ncbi:MAG: hypothetical protein FWD64_03645 [Acidobacteriaceae bacterium]|nr:hypothetical protein [Acidobacteriaceae bacterium]
MSIRQKFVPSSLLRPGSAAARVSHDVSTGSRPHLLHFPSRHEDAPPKRDLRLFPHESEDARLTGATRSLFRRLLALNLPEDGHEKIPVASEKHVDTILTGTKGHVH